MVRPPCSERLNAKKGNWSKEEDVKMLAYVPKQRTSNYTDASKRTGLGKCRTSCKRKCSNQSRPEKKHETFTPQEEELIINLHAAIGSRWSIIATLFPGRTDNDVKNCWKTKLWKKLLEMGIDPFTHKPFSQFLSDAVRSLECLKCLTSTTVPLAIDDNVPLKQYENIKIEKK